MNEIDFAKGSAPHHTHRHKTRHHVHTQLLYTLSGSNMNTSQYNFTTTHTFFLLLTVSRRHSCVKRGKDRIRSCFFCFFFFAHAINNFEKKMRNLLFRNQPTAKYPADPESICGLICNVLISKINCRSYDMKDTAVFES